MKVSLTYSGDVLLSLSLSCTKSNTSPPFKSNAVSLLILKIIGDRSFSLAGHRASNSLSRSLLEGAVTYSHATPGTVPALLRTYHSAIHVGPLIWLVSAPTTSDMEKLTDSVPIAHGFCARYMQIIQRSNCRVSYTFHLYYKKIVLYYHCIINLLLTHHFTFGDGRADCKPTPKLTRRWHFSSQKWYTGNYSKENKVST